VEVEHESFQGRQPISGLPKAEHTKKIMRTIKRRLDKLERYHGGQFLAWLKMATDDELEARLCKIIAAWKGCKPEEVNLSPKNTLALAEELKAELFRGRQCKK
jgi:hypothetical protein